MPLKIIKQPQFFFCCICLILWGQFASKGFMFCTGMGKCSLFAPVKSKYLLFSLQSLLYNNKCDPQQKHCYIYYIATQVKIFLKVDAGVYIAFVKNINARFFFPMCAAHEGGGALGGWAQPEAPSCQQHRETQEVPAVPPTHRGTQVRRRMGRKKSNGNDSSNMDGVKWVSGRSNTSPVWLQSSHISLFFFLNTLLVFFSCPRVSNANPEWMNEFEPFLTSP